MSPNPEADDTKPYGSNFKNEDHRLAVQDPHGNRIIQSPDGKKRLSITNAQFYFVFSGLTREEKRKQFAKASRDVQKGAGLEHVLIGNALVRTNKSSMPTNYAVFVKDGKEVETVRLAPYGASSFDYITKAAHLLGIKPDWEFVYVVLKQHGKAISGFAVMQSQNQFKLKAVNDTRTTIGWDRNGKKYEFNIEKHSPVKAIQDAKDL